MPAAAAHVTVQSIRRRFEQIARQVGRPSTFSGSMTAPSPWFSTKDLAEYLRLTGRRRPLEAARDWAARHHIVSVVVNRERRYARLDVERALGPAR
jgi:hypothetical protein